MSTLGYLLKHAHLRFFEIAAAALEPLGISGHEAAVLRNIGAQAPLSQNEVARRMGIDRTTMVALIDSLEGKDLVRRRQDPADRRRNVVEMTDAGRSVSARADEAAAKAEREFFGVLSAGEAERFKATLETLLRHELPAGGRDVAAGAAPGQGPHRPGLPRGHRRRGARE